MRDLLQGKRIVVTGSSSGIGWETAKLLSEQGADVLGVDINKNFDHVEEFYRADLSDPRAIDALVDVLPDGIDGLVNNAGLPPTRPAEQLLAINLLAVKRLTTKVVAKMKDGGSIVNVASLAGFGWPEAVDAIKASETLDFGGIAEFMAEHNITNEGGRSYFFTKEALIAWTMQNRWTWRSRGIRMNAVSPGPIDTPILDDFLETLGARAQESVRNMDRFGRPEDIAPTIAFLLSDEAAWFRGSNITPDGGMGAHLALKRHGLI